MGLLCSWKSGLCQIGVYLHGASDDLVICLLVFHQAVRVVWIVVFLEELSFFIDCGRKGRSVIEVVLH